MRLCHDVWHASDVNWAMAEAAGGGHEAIVRLCHDEWGASDINRAMAEAIVRMCHDEYGAADIDRAVSATNGSHEAILRL